MTTLYFLTALNHLTLTINTYSPQNCALPSHIQGSQTCNTIHSQHIVGGFKDLYYFVSQQDCSIWLGGRGEIRSEAGVGRSMIGGNVTVTVLPHRSNSFSGRGWGDLQERVSNISLIKESQNNNTIQNKTKPLAEEFLASRYCMVKIPNLELEISYCKVGRVAGKGEKKQM